jgi:hypothetical protein
MEVRDCGRRKDAEPREPTEEKSDPCSREDDVHRYFGVDRYVRPIDSAPHFCPNRY